MRESKVESYLRKQVEKAGGTCEKFVSPGKRFVPDRLITWPTGTVIILHPLNQFMNLVAQLDLAETKATNGRVNAGQARDHVRRRKQGATVMVLSSREDVDWYITWRLTGIG